MNRKKQSYTEEFKAGAVKLVTEQDLSHSEVGRRLGTSSKNVSRWVQEQQDATEARITNTESSAELKARIKALEKENTRLKMERDILKKATAFFAKEST